MALRILEVQVGEQVALQAEEVLRGIGASDVWTEAGGELGHAVRAVLGSERTGEALDGLHERLSPHGRFRILVTPLDAMLPRPTATDLVHERSRPASAAAVSREEVYAAVQEGTRLSSTYLMLAVLATIVAAIGLINDDATAVIGAMVVAPLLGPNMGMALGFTLGDRALIWEGLRASGAGVTVSFLVSVALGRLADVSPGIPEIASRTIVAPSDMLLAFAAGAAGTLAYTTGAPTYLVGVMVAVAMLPPTVASGLLAGAGYYWEAYEALLLVATNVAGVTLAAMLTFRWRGMRPRDWWREEHARSSARLGFVIFALLGAALAGLIVMSGNWFAR